MQRRAVRWVSTLVVVGLVTVLAACQPPPPPPVLIVTSTDAGADAVPGDGVCEVTSGAGDCTLPAAVDEANATGQADIDLPAGVYIAMDLTITSAIRVNPSSPSRPIGLRSVNLTVAPGASLLLDGVHLAVSPDDTVIPTTAITVHGHLGLRRTSLMNTGSPTVRVAPGGLAAIDSSIIGGGLTFDAAAIANEGLVVIRHSQIRGYSTPAILTSGAGITQVGSSVLMASTLRIGLKPLCTGTPPVSLGYNVAADATCGLSGPGDLEDTSVTFEGTPPLPHSDFGLAIPTAGSAVIDRVPIGVAGCGTGVTEDFDQRPRPVDGDGDGTGGCDSGPGERPPA